MGKRRGKQQKEKEEEEDDDDKKKKKKKKPQLTVRIRSPALAMSSPQKLTTKFVPSPH